MAILNEGGQTVVPKFFGELKQAHHGFSVAFQAGKAWQGKVEQDLPHSGICPFALAIEKHTDVPLEYVVESVASIEKFEYGNK